MRLRNPACLVLLISGLLTMSVTLATANTRTPQPGQTTILEKFPGGINMKFNRSESRGDTVVADGSVEIIYKNVTLFADHVEINTKTKDVLALGNVVLHIREKEAAAPAGEDPAKISDATEVINSDRLELNLDTAQGRLEKAFGLIQPTFFFDASSIERGAASDRMEKMSFTSCAQAVPRWKFSAAKASLVKDRYVEMWGAKFSIKNVPVFYWPYMRYPLGEERSTGFMMPEWGYSGTKGIAFSESFYWAIARNVDATLQADYYGKKGFGGGVEGRYLFGGGTNGAFTLYLFKLKPAEGADPSSQPATASIMRWNHIQTLPGGFNLTADIDSQSNYSFLREFDNDFQRATVSNRRSQIFLSKSWSKLSFSIRASQFETYFPDQSGAEGNAIITRYLPQISLNTYKLKLFGPLYLSVGSTFSRWRYGWKTDFDAGKELGTQSLNFAPALSAPISLAPWLSASFSIAGSLTYFWQSYGNNPETGAWGIVDEPIISSFYSLGAEVIGPVFWKRYDFKSVSYKHVIEPSVTYRFDTPIVNGDRIISAYGTFRYHQFVYGLTNHVYVKPGGVGSTEPSREVFTWGLSQAFYLAPETGPLRYYRVDGLPPKLSDISSYLRFFPSANYSLDITAGYNPYYQSVSSLRLGANIGLPTDNWFLNVSWFKSINAWLRGAAAEAAGGVLPIGYSSYWDRHQISLFGGLKIPRWDLEAQGEVDYNFTQKKLLYAAGDITYHYQCLDLKAEVRVFFYRDVPEVRFNFSVGIGSLGRAGNLLGGLGF